MSAPESDARQLGRTAAKSCLHSLFCCLVMRFYWDARFLSELSMHRAEAARQITVNLGVAYRAGPLGRYSRYKFTLFADFELLKPHGTA